MTRQAFYTLFATRIQAVVGDAKIHRAYQEAAPPTTGLYLAINDGASWKPVGTVSRGATDGEERQLKHDYEVTVELWEIRGDGELLQKVLESFDTQVSVAYFKAANVGVLRTTDAMKMPEALDGAKYTKRVRAEVVFSVARVSVEDMLAIETVTFTPTFTHET